MSDAILLDLLTPGSVYNSKSKKNPQTYVVLFRANQDIKTKDGSPSKHQDSVVFVDSRNRIRSIPTDEFLSRCEFHHVDGDIEQRVNNLFSDEDETENPTPEVDTEAEEHLLEKLLGNAPSHEDQPDVDHSDDLPITYFGSKNTNDPSVMDRLSFATVSYSQRPDMSQSALMHELTIDVTDLGFDTVEELFRMSNEDGIAAFQIDGHPIVNWDIGYGVYHTYSGNTHYATVIVGVTMAVDQEEVIESETIVELAEPVDPSLVPDSAKDLVADAVADLANLDPQIPQTVA